MWLQLSFLILTVVSVLSVPYGYNNYNTNAQIYHPISFEARKPNDDVKISHTLQTVNKEYGLMPHLTPTISNPPRYYQFAPVTTPFPQTTQSQLHFNPALVRQHYMVPVSPKINYFEPIITTNVPITKLNAAVPTKKSHNDLEYQNTHKFEKAYDDSDDDDEDDESADDSQKYHSGNLSQKQEAAHGNDPRDPKLQKAEVKLPERKDRIDFQVYGFDGPKSYKFGYDTGKGENRQFRYETRDRDGNVSGRYGYVDRTGKLNVVKYTSNVDDGFRTDTLNNK